MIIRFFHTITSTINSSVTYKSIKIAFNRLSCTNQIVHKSIIFLNLLTEPKIPENCFTINLQLITSVIIIIIIEMFTNPFNINCFQNYLSKYHNNTFTLSHNMQ